MTDPRAVTTTQQRLRDSATGIEAGNVADPHGRRSGLLRQAADELEAAETALAELSARDANLREALERTVKWSEGCLARGEDGAPHWLHVLIDAALAIAPSEALSLRDKQIERGALERAAKVVRSFLESHSGGCSISYVLPMVEESIEALADEVA